MSFGQYVIDRSKIIARSSRANIYLGTNIENGEIVVMKTSYESLKKESEIYNNLDHWNIVKYYKYFNYRQEYFIVMEYCNRGSLLDFVYIQNGLCDNMLLKTLACLCHGIKYLRSKDLMHRDIKPGNLMVHMDDSGEFYVKLGDFGESKKVEEGEVFSTLAGTIEYLSPELFIRLTNQEVKKHSPNVDLWSIGVTIYHAITVKLPFVPFNNNFRQSLEVIIEMYKRIPKGAIGGKQKKKDWSKIDWDFDLPKEVGISPMLSQLVSDLVALLFNKEVSYDEYYKKAEQILRKKRVLVFTPNDGLLQYLYLDNLNFDSIMEEACKIQKLSNNDLTLLTKYQRLERETCGESDILSDTPAKGHLHYDVTDDIVFIVPVSSRANQIAGKSASHMRRANLKNADKPANAGNASEQQDKYAKEQMKSIYQIHHEFSYLKCQSACYQFTVKSFIKHTVNKRLDELFVFLPTEYEHTKTQCDHLERFLKIFKKAKVANDNDAITNFEESIIKKRKEAEELKQKILEVYNKNVVKKCLLRMIDEDIGKISYNEQSDMNHVVHLAEEVLNSVQLMNRQRTDEPNKESQLQIWSQEMAQYKYHEKAIDLITKQKQRVEELQENYTSKWLPGIEAEIDKICSFQQWKKIDAEIDLLFDQIIDFYKSTAANTSNGENTTNLECFRQKLEDIRKEAHKLKQSVGAGRL